MIELSAREMLTRDGDYLAQTQALRDEVKLGEAWRNFMAGRSVTAEEATAMMTDLLLASGYYEVAPPDATADMLQRREGKREVMARILFLSDLPGSHITKLRRDALDELQKIEARE